MDVAISQLHCTCPVQSVRPPTLANASHGVSTAVTIDALQCVWALGFSSIDLFGTCCSAPTFIASACIWSTANTVYTGVSAHWANALAYVIVASGESPPKIALAFTIFKAFTRAATSKIAIKHARFLVLWAY